jgi:hypothetical protein
LKKEEKKYRKYGREVIIEYTTFFLSLSSFSTPLNGVLDAHKTSKWQLMASVVYSSARDLEFRERCSCITLSPNSHALTSSQTWTERGQRRRRLSTNQSILLLLVLRR